MHHSVNQWGQPVGHAVVDWTPPPPLPRQAMVGRLCRVEPLEIGTHVTDLFAANALDTEGRLFTYFSYGPFPSLEEYREWMQRMCLGADPLFFAIVDVRKGGAVGLASYKRIDPANGSVEIGHVAFSPLLQKSAAATEAMFLMIDRAFSLGYRRCEWKCNALNAPSRAAARRLGMSFEGIARQSGVRKGANLDTAGFAMTDTDWDALRGVFLAWMSPSNFGDDGRQRTRLSDLTAKVRLGPDFQRETRPPAVDRIGIPLPAGLG